MPNCAETGLGRFEVVRELARGPDSTVYLARDPAIERTVVIRLFGKNSVNQDSLTERVRSVNELSDTGIAKIFDLAFREPDGDPYLVVEFVEGKSLEEILAKGKLSEAEALDLTVDLLKALSYAHGHGICHHNLKPSNLIVTPDGHLKVTDLVASGRGGATPFTAPERLKGNGDGRSDLFSVGVILYLMLSGFRPFQGSTEATIGFKLVHQHPVPVAAMDLKLSPELDFVIGRFLAKSPENRYQKAEEAIRDIDRIRKAKAEGAITWPSGQKSGTPADLLEVLGFRSALPLVHESRNSRINRGGARFRWLGILAGIAVAAPILLAEVMPFMGDIPAAPVLSAHLQVPTPVVERQTEPSKRHRNAAERASGETVAQQVSRAYVPKTDIVAVPVELRQPFRECVMSIWVDEKLAYQNQIRGERKSRLLHLGSSSAEYLTLVLIPAGNHSVRVELSGLGENYSASGSLSATFSRTNGQKLRITAEKSHPQLDLQLN